MRAAIYARYSSDNQRDESIDAQVRMCREYAEKKGYTCVATYSDKAISGRSVEHRVEFLRMVDSAKAQRFDILIVDKVDRFGRNRYDSAIYKRELKQAGVKVEYASQHIEDSPEGVILESLLEGLAEYYSLNLAREAVKGLTENALKGWHCGGRAPFGLRLIPAGGRSKKYAINEQEAPLVRRVFEIVAEGGSYGDVQEQTKEQAILLRGRPLAKNAIYDMLRNERYKGTFVWNQGSRENQRQDREDCIRIPNAFPAIVDPELFVRVQALLDTRKCPAKRGQRRAEKVNILAGKVICGKCGASLVRHVHGVNKVRYDYLACNVRKRSKECDAKMVREDYVTNLVLHSLKQQVFSEEGKRRIVERLGRHLKEQSGHYEEQLQRLAVERRECRRTVDNVVRAVSQGFISDALRKQLHSAEGRLKEIDRLVMEIKKKQATTFNNDLLIGMLELQERKLDGNPQEQASLVETYVNSVEVHDEETIIDFIIFDDLCMQVVTLRGNGRLAQIPKSQQTIGFVSV